MNQIQAVQRAAKEINLREILTVMKKRAWIVLLISFLCSMAGWYYSKVNQVTPLYGTSTNIIINADAGYRKTLEVIIKDTVVLSKVIEELKLELTPEMLAGNIQVGSIDDTQVVKISVVDTDPERAAAIANTTADVFIKEVPTIMNFKDVRVLSEAQPNIFPINESNGNKFIVVASIMGIMIGVGFIFLLDSLDDRIQTAEEVEALLEVPVLGKLSKMNNKNISKKQKKRLTVTKGDNSYVVK